MQQYNTYECGFDPYGEVKNKYDMSFYMMGLLFLLFDMEMMYLYPMMYMYNMYSYMYMLMFLMMMTLGLMYEYRYSSMSE